MGCDLVELEIVRRSNFVRQMKNVNVAEGSVGAYLKGHHPCNKYRRIQREHYDCQFVPCARNRHVNVSCCHFRKD